MSSTLSKPRVLVTRVVFPDVIEHLSQHCDVETNTDDVAWSRDELLARLQGKSGLMAVGLERVDAQLLARCPQLKICANVAVGYNNLDLDAMSAAGVLGTNTPDVLTETTAD